MKLNQEKQVLKRIEEKLLKRRAAKTIMYQIKKEKENLRKRAIMYKICPDCGGDLRQTNGRLREFFTQHTHYLCQSCGRKYKCYSTRGDCGG